MKNKFILKYGPLVYLVAFITAASIAGFINFNNGVSKDESIHMVFRFIPIAIAFTYLIAERSIYTGFSAKKRNFLMLGLIAFTVVIWALGELTFRNVENESVVTVLYLLLISINLIVFEFLRKISTLGSKGTH